MPDAWPPANLTKKSLYFHADGKLPRLREDDFHLLSALGPVDGADSSAESVAGMLSH